MHNFFFFMIFVPVNFINELYFRNICNKFIFSVKNVHVYIIRIEMKNSVFK